VATLSREHPAHVNAAATHPIIRIGFLIELCLNVELPVVFCRTIPVNEPAQLVSSMASSRNRRVRWGGMVGQLHLIM
jgi:hypothetical protein